MKKFITYLSATILTAVIASPSYASILGMPGSIQLPGMPGFGLQGGMPQHAMQHQPVHCHFGPELLLAQSVDSCENAGGMVSPAQKPITPKPNAANGSEPIVLMLTPNGVVQIPFAAVSRP